MKKFKISYTYVHSMTRFLVTSVFLAKDRGDAIFKIEKQHIGTSITFLSVELDK